MMEQQAHHHKPNPKLNVLVLGAGIIGLTSAVRILQSLRAMYVNVEVCVLASGVDLDTTSSGAGAIWWPTLAKPVHQVARWSKLTLLEYVDQINASEGVDQTQHRKHNANHKGLIMRDGFIFSTSGDVESGKPDWLHYYCENGDEELVGDVLRFKVVTDAEQSGILQRNNACTHVYTAQTPIADMPKYLTYVRCELFEKQLGGRFVKLDRPLENMEWDLVHNVIANRKKYQLFSESNRVDLIVNCTGLGSRELFNDKDMIPVRGQTYLVYAPWIKDFFFDVEKDGIEAYVIPRTNGIVVMGGTFDVGQEDCTFDEERGRVILERCIRISGSHHVKPQDLTIVRRWVGLRPYRESGVRLEREDIELLFPQELERENAASTRMVPTRVPIVHAYGTGGSGMTLAWGMASDVGDLVRDIVIKCETAAPIVGRSKL